VWMSRLQRHRGGNARDKWRLGLGSPGDDRFVQACSRVDRVVLYFSPG